MDYEECSPRSPSLKNRILNSNCFSSCFGGGASSSAWNRSEIPEIKDRCRGFASRIGGHRRRYSGGGGGFRYDPLSYALNFDEGADGDALDGEPLRYKNFSSRLPHSPPPASPAAGVAVGF